ncbi:hypothetical protein [Paenibacillus sp. Soil724D2]|uniref:hypothetical protein n=1 Tax=Paenibacillus sp. (strain Soil724D2) TaxID=1736392 RepID=UPI0007162895|nr:hypothetical protein [Paenibacillus sp. Soil724D2]KRE45212.1 hypothetical protein ASG85_31800 [Paenibacillus sp. Soil724D2]
MEKKVKRNFEKLWSPTAAAVAKVVHRRTLFMQIRKTLPIVARNTTFPAQSGRFERNRVKFLYKIQPIQIDGAKLRKLLHSVQLWTSHWEEKKKVGAEGEQQKRK